MENHARDPIIVLKIEIGAEECSQVLEKQLLRIEGVEKVSIDRDKKEVRIIGYIDPLMLIKHIAKWVKKVELLFYEKNPKTIQSNFSGNHHKSSQNCRAKHPPICHYRQEDIGETSKEKYFGYPSHHHDHNKHHGSSAAKDVEEEKLYHNQSGKFHPGKEFEEGMWRDQYDGQFYDENYRSAPRKKVEQDQNQYAHFNSVHNAAKGAQETCWGKAGHFHGGSSRNTHGFVPPKKHDQCGKYHSFPDPMEDFTHPHHGKEEMNRGQCGQFVPPRNTKYGQYDQFEEDTSRGGDGHFNEGSRNANYGHNENIYGNPKDHFSHNANFREHNIQEEIKQARKDMDRFFNIRRAANHFTGESYGGHHEMPNPTQWTRQAPASDPDYYHDRNPPPQHAFGGWPAPDFGFSEKPPPYEHCHERMPPSPPPPPHLYRGRPVTGTYYDTLTNLFSDENPSSCTII